MAKSSLSVLLFFILGTLSFVLSTAVADLTSPYLSPTTIFPNYQKMLHTFRIFICSPQNTKNPISYNTPAESLFHASLVNSPFVTQNPNEAHLFFVLFPSDFSTRSIARFVRDLRMELPYWNRTLGADHFYMSCAGIGYESDRNLVELKKNSIQISCFPTPYGKFIPHKDITLPPFNPLPHSLPQAPVNKTATFLGYFRSYGDRGDGESQSSLVNDLSGDPEFVIGSNASDQLTHMVRLASSKFCLFFYAVDVSGIGDALRFGCVPVVITEGPIQDLPFLDVIRWSEIAVFVGTGGGAKELKHVLERTCKDGYERMRGLGMKSSQHWVWNESPQPYDAFHTVLFQLWSRRHAIRYARREWV